MRSFNEQLLNSIDNPFRYPHPPHRPPFIIGGEQIVEWFKTRYQESIGQGSKISFIVGVPGAGKSHLLSHLEYLFYDAKDRIKGIYAIYNARHEEIDEKALWINLFWGESVLDALKQMIDASKIKNSKIPPNIQIRLTKLLERQLDLDALDTNTLHNMAEGLSKLLVKENAGICIAIDNIDEYFRKMIEKYQEKYTKEEARDRVAANLLGTIRVATAGLDQIVVLLACTEDVHDQIMQARVDVTYGRRVEAQQKKLQELSSHQAVELVNKYLDWWARMHGIGLPSIEDEEYSMMDPKGQRILVYPFSMKAIEYFHKVTRAMPGDIVCLCGQCVNDMRRERSISVVRGATIHYELQEAKRTYPQLVLKSDIIDKERPLYMKELMEKRLKLILKEMRSAGSDFKRITDAFEMYASELGINKGTVSSTKRYPEFLHLIPLSENSRIWEYKQKRILVKYIIGPHPGLGEPGREFGWGKEIETQDKIEARSCLEDESTGVTHVLFVTRWSKPLIGDIWLYGAGMEKFRSVISEFNIDAFVEKVVGVVEDSSEHRKDLIQHIEHCDGENYRGAHLLMILDSLTERTTSGKSLEQRRREDKEVMARF